MKSFKILLFASAVALISGCTDFLDRTPLVNLNADDYYSTEDELYAAVMGAYSVLQHETFQLGHFLILGDVCSDDADLGNSRSEAYSWLGGEAIACQNFSVLPNNGQIEGTWYQCWTLVNDATQIIERADGTDITDAQIYVGEAQFLRAYAYFQLVTQYGAMPIVDHILTYDEYYMSRATLEETWEHIENDLTNAIENLPETWDSSNEGRVTKGAAMSMLARAYVYQSEWQNAYDMLSGVINGGWYQLEPVFSDIFSMENENGQECIFAIQHSISGTGWSDSNEGSILEFYEHDAGLTQEDIDSGNYPGEEVYEKWMVGWSMHCPTLDLINEFEDGDPRLEATVIAPGEYYDDHYHYNLSSDNGYQPKKYYVPYDYRSTEDQSDLPKNIIVLRYADILLYMAEACNELGRTSEALEYLEMVRARARSNSSDSSVLPEVTVTDQVQLREAIWHERRVELALEYQRFWDLARQGRVGEVMLAYYQNYNESYTNVRGETISGTVKGQNFVIGKNEIWPIPTAAIDASNGAIEQNPGY